MHPPTPNPRIDAVALYARVLAGVRFSDAAERLVAALAEAFQCSRASLALHDSGRTRLVAGPLAGAAQAQGELPQKLLGALDEAIEQSISLAWPDPADDPAGDESTAALPPIRFELKALQRLVGGTVACVPLGLHGEPFLALCLERGAGEACAPFTPADLALLEQLLVLAVPALHWMHLDSQPWRTRAWRSALHTAAPWRRPQRATARRLVAAGTAALLLLALLPLEQGVAGRARIEGAEQRVLAAPTDGFVKAAHVRPGDRVKAGDALVDLLDADLRLERERSSSQLAQHENAWSAAMAKSDRAAAAISMAHASEAQSQLALVDEQLARGRVVAPFDALVIQGDLSQSIGAPVRQGDTLMTLATTGHYRVIVEVDETDIARVQRGQSGQLSLSSLLALPWGRDGLVVERIAPLAKAVDGRNVFEVEARLVGPPGGPRADLRPGLLGRATLVVGRTPLLWALAQGTASRVRVAWWHWLA